MKSKKNRKKHILNIFILPIMVFVLIAIIGYTNISQLNKINNLMITSFTGAVMPLKNFDRLQTKMNSIRKNTFNHIVSTEKIKKYILRNQIIKESKSLLFLLENMTGDENIKSDVKKLTQKWILHKKFLDKVLVLSDRKQQQKAIQIFTVEGEASFYEILNMMNSIRQTILKNTRLYKRQGAQVRERSVYISILVGIASFIILWILFTLIWKITQQRDKLEKYQKRISFDLNLAKNVQRDLIVTTLPVIEGISIGAKSIPSTELGGDYFEFFQIDKNRFGIVIADVSGHGVAPALITSMIKISFEDIIDSTPEPDKVFNYINKKIANSIADTGLFFTAFYSVIDIKNMQITSVCAGHAPALCINKKTGVIHEIMETEKVGTIIGVTTDMEFQSSTYKIEKGQKLLYFTDGITEAKNIEGEEYGSKRLTAFLKKNSNLRAPEFIDTLISDVDRFYQGREANDDRTTVVIDIDNISTP